MGFRRVPREFLYTSSLNLLLLLLRRGLYQFLTGRHANMRARQAGVAFERPRRSGTDPGRNSIRDGRHPSFTRRAPMNIHVLGKRSIPSLNKAMLLESHARLYLNTYSLCSNASAANP
jgi:hypothetical protein